MTAPIAIATPRGLARKGGTTIAMKAGALGLQAAQFAVIARSLTVDDFSSYAAATALLVIVGTVAEFGLIQTGVVAMSEGHPPDEVAGSNLKATGVTIVAAVTVVGALTLLLLRGDARLAILALLPGFIVARVDTPFLSWHIFHLETTRVAVADLTSRMVLFICAVPLLFLDAASTSVAFIVVGAGLLLCELTSFLIVIPGVRFARRQHSISTKELLTRSIPIGLTNTSSLVHSRSDQVLLDTLRRPVAGYSIAARINEAVLALVNAGGLVSLGAAARSIGAERDLAVRRFVTIGAFVGFIAAIATSLLAPTLVRLVGGPTYTDASALLRLLAPALAASVMNLPLAQTAILAGQASRLFRCSVAGVVLNLVLTVWLVLTIDTRGAALATSITELFGLGLSAWIVAAVLPRAVPRRTVVLVPTILIASCLALAVLPSAAAAAIVAVMFGIVLSVCWVDAGTRSAPNPGSPEAAP